MKKEIYPCLWFDGNAKEAAEFYSSVFKDAKICSENPMVEFWSMNGQKFMGINGGPKYKPNPSVSFFVVCETASELESYWDKLKDKGTVLMPLDKYDWSEKYGWVQDKFGVNWQLSAGNLSDVGQKFTPTLLFTKENAGLAEDAIHFYTSLFDNSSVTGILKYEAGEHDKEGFVKHAQFSLNGNVFMAMDSSASHNFVFSEGVSFVVECDNQNEIDHFWNRLTEEGEESMCGWLKDKFGVSWQIVPSVLGELMNSEKAPRVMQAFLKMKKFEIAVLENV